MNSKVYSIDEIKDKVKDVADVYDINRILLFGSYFNGNPNANSDIDILIDYGDKCRGYKRIEFLDALEDHLQTNVDAYNTKFSPSFITKKDLNDERRVIYVRSAKNTVLSK